MNGELRDQLDRERKRVDRLEEELRDLRRPFWVRWWHQGRGT